jgi:hypothetical protein
MSLRLFINGQLTDITASTVIAQTKSVNDINSINNRNANYTNTFKIPKTATNMRIMDFMTVTGNTSLVPYQKNEITLFSDNGECFIFKGWGMITDEGDFYEVAIIDGITDLYKSIENKTLADEPLKLPELNHQKDIATVKATWASDLPYKYILADYNGNTGQTNTTPENPIPVVNIDYLVPSVNVAWLWNKIMMAYKAAYNGDVFQSRDFTELWMTFPKGVTITGENDHEVFDSTDYSFYTKNARSAYYAKFKSSSVNELLSSPDSIHMQVRDAGTYRMEIKGKLFGYAGAKPDPGSTVASRLILAKNAVGMQPEDARNKPAFDANSQFVLGDAAENIMHGSDINVTSNLFQLEAGDFISIVVVGQLLTRAFNLLNTTSGNNLEVELYRIDPNVIDFTSAFSDFAVKDFINEVVHRFGLTIFKDKYSNAYEFLTLSEQLENAEVVNWTNKFSRKISENYVYGTYAQRNWLRYNYNDKEATHHDGFMTVKNVNLQDSRDVIKSKIYAPEKQKVTYLNEQTNVYKLWEKEAVDSPGPNDDPVKYKQLDKRYYFIRDISVGKDIRLKSNGLNTSGSASEYYRESYTNLSFQDVVQNYYAPLQRILDNATIISAEIWLQDTDVVNFDFRKLYYIEQLSNYYLVNKIENFVPGKVTKCELVRVKLTEPASTFYTIEITNYESFYNNVTLYLQASYDFVNVTAQYSYDGKTWVSRSTSGTSPIQLSVPGRAFYYFRIIDESNGVTSNTISFKI